MKLTTRAALVLAAMTAMLVPLATPAAAAEKPKVTEVANLAEYVAAVKEGRAAKMVALAPEDGVIHGRGPNGEQSQVLDVELWRTANRSRVQTWQKMTTGNTANQRWSMIDLDTWNGYPVVALMDNNSWDGNNYNCLDESRDAPAKNGTAVYMYDCSFDDNQLWRLVSSSKFPGYIELRNDYDGRCLDIKDFAYSNGASIQVWDCNKDWNQAWV